MGSWNVMFDEGQLWPLNVPNEEEKRAVAAKMAGRLRAGDVVGVGSGTTSLLTLEALVSRARREQIDWTAITTSREIELTCARLSVPTSSLASLRPDWSFDGADEVDDQVNLIKGRGGALLAEKLVMAASLERYVVIDRSKLVEHLGQRFAVPIEVLPEAVSFVRQCLQELDCTEVSLRLAQGKDGPLITEHGNLLLDVRLRSITDQSERDLKSIPGVVDTGLFIGYSPEVVVSG
ncbi:MAG: ribose 5-phosphate isomerase A [Acidimicrobiales bacterium]